MYFFRISLSYLFTVTADNIYKIEKPGLHIRQSSSLGGINHNMFLQSDAAWCYKFSPSISLFGVSPSLLCRLLMEIASIYFYCAG
jgi:hypothetical protein